MKQTSIGNTLRDIANESLLNCAEKTSLRRIAKEYDTLKASHNELVEQLKNDDRLIELANKILYRKRPPIEALRFIFPALEKAENL